MQPKTVYAGLLLILLIDPMWAEEPPAAQNLGEKSTIRETPSRWGGTFGGTFAYDNDVGYDFGPFDDNGLAPGRYMANRGKKDRMPGKRSDPGDIDFADFTTSGT